MSYGDVYDRVILPDIGRLPPRLAILKMNEWIIDRCDTLVCYVEKDYGGAYKALKYAEMRGREIINLAPTGSVL